MSNGEDKVVGSSMLAEQRLAEFVALRNEILFHMESQRKILLGVWTLSGAFFAFGYKEGSSTLLLLIPPIVFVGGLHWAHAAASIMKIGGYICTYLEKELPGLRWEGQGKRANRPVWYSMARADQWAPMVSAFVIGLMAMLLWCGNAVYSTGQIAGLRDWVLASLKVVDWVLVFVSPCLFRWRQ